MKSEGLDRLKKEYMETPIPEELDPLVRKALKDSGAYRGKRKAVLKRAGVLAASIVIAIVVVAAGVNISPAFAATLSKVPVIGSIVRVLTFREYAVNQGMHNADIKVPAIQGLKNKALQNSLNQKYLEEGKKLYEDFTAETKMDADGHLGVDSGYVVKTDTDRLLSVGRYYVNTVGSSSTTFKYDTIDKKNQILITLPSLFKDDSYIGVISENIKKQMIEKHRSDEDKLYWVAGVYDDGNIELFEKISKDQNFYITAKGKLVISFDKYQVAPGYMGIVEFEIPTNVISGILVGNQYIK